MTASTNPVTGPVRRSVTRVRAELGGLTTRGRSFISAGVASALCAVVLGQQDLLRIAVLLISLPLLCVAFLTRARYRVGLTRTVEPRRVAAGDTLRVRLDLQDLARSGTQVLLAEDQTPAALGPPTRFVLSRLGAGRSVSVTYSLRASARGRYPVGPMRLRVGDPFGMCETSRSFTATTPVTVLPRTWSLRGAGGGGTWGGAGDSLPRAAAVHGEDDVATREYREGDDLRRIHWRSTAKRDELMVRREEQPRQLRATVLLDCRDEAHRGSGPASSFEWAVAMAASVAVHLNDLRYGVRLVTDGAPIGWSRPGAADDGAELLDRFALVRTATERDPARPDDVLDEAIEVLQQAGGDGIVVAVLGAVQQSGQGPGTAGHARLEELTRLAHRGVPCLAIVLRTVQWGFSATEPDPAAERTASALREAGWAVALAGPSSIGDQVWAEVIGSALGGPARTSSTEATR